MKNLMKYYISGLMMLTMICSCSEDMDNIPVSEGDEIRFSAYVDKAKSRTYYGTYNEEGYWPVYWENGDEVLVYCPQAHSNGVQIETYTLSVSGDDQNIVELSNGLSGMKWGSVDAHHFHSFFPAERVFTAADVSGKPEGTLVFSVNREQTAIPVVKYADEDFKAHYADMKSAIMSGHISYNRSSVTDDQVLELPFTPITTALDIELYGPTTLDKSTVEESSHKVTITGITISDAARTASTAQPVAGGFYYCPNPASTTSSTPFYEAFVNNSTSNTTDGTASTLHITLNPAVTLTIQEGENAIPEKLKVTAFLLPQIPDELQITIHCDGDNGQTANLVRTVKKPTSNGDGYKCKVQVGKVTTPVEFSYEHWMASLDDNTYVSQISMPGTHDAGAYEAVDIWDGLGQCQTLNIIEQLNAGIRVLDFRPQWQGTTTSLQSESDGGKFAIAHGMISYDVTFENVMDQVLVWLAEHPTEFVMVLLKNEYGTGDATSSSNQTEFFGWQRNIRNRMENINPNYVIEDFNPSMTLGEGRGKIVFISRDYYVPSNISDADWSTVMNAQIDGTYDQTTFVDWYGGKVAGWPDNTASWSRTIYTHSIPNGGSGNFYVSDLYGGKIIGFLDIAAPDTDEKKSAIANNLSAAADPNTSISDWYMTWLNARADTYSYSIPFVGEVTRYGRETAYWNNCANNIIATYTRETYQKTGIVMLDWAAESDDNDTYNGYDVIKTVINNNWLTNGEQGPSIKTN